MNGKGVVLVTGATSGIGRAFATALAGAGHQIVLVARDEARLQELAEELPSGPHEVLSSDLSTDSGCMAVAERLDRDDVPIELLVNAAGIGTNEMFPGASLEQEEQQLAVNVRAVLRLSWTAARAMRRRRSGSIINIASTAAFWSTGTYAASKSWVVFASEGLIAGLADTQVRVLCVIPGFTRTEFHSRSAVDNSGVAGWLWLTPDQVAAEALSALDAGRTHCVPGRQYRALLPLVKALPWRARRAILRRLAPLSASTEDRR